MKFNIKIANHVISISTIYDMTYNLCENYITDLNADIEVIVTKDNIEYEQKKYLSDSQLANKCIEVYSDAYFETLAVYRKIALKMLDHDTLLFHGSAIAVDGEAYVFTAKSGVGKSTHVRMWKEHFKDRSTIINDDKPLLYFADNEIYVCGTPWDGKHRLSSNISVPLRAIVILERDIENSIYKIDKKIALPIIYQQSFRPNEPAKLKKVMKLLDKLLHNVDIYSLKCNMEKEAVIVSYDGMNKRSRKL